MRPAVPHPPCLGLTSVAGISSAGRNVAQTSREISHSTEQGGGWEKDSHERGIKAPACKSKAITDVCALLLDKHLHFDGRVGGGGGGDKRTPTYSIVMLISAEEYSSVTGGMKNACSFALLLP